MRRRTSHFCHRRHVYRRQQVHYRRLILRSRRHLIDAWYKIGMREQHINCSLLYLERTVTDAYSQRAFRNRQRAKREDMESKIMRAKIAEREAKLSERNALARVKMLEDAVSRLFVKSLKQDKQYKQSLARVTMVESSLSRLFVSELRKAHLGCPQCQRCSMAPISRQNVHV